MTPLLFLLTQYIYIYRVSIHCIHVILLLFLLSVYLSIYIGCVYIHGNYVTTNDETNNNVFIFVSDLKIVYKTTINPRS